MGILDDIALMKSSEERLAVKKKVLWELSSNYLEIKDNAKTISSLLELARLGDCKGYLKIGELYMQMKDYPNAIKYH